MSLFVLDTDHITLFQRGHPQVTARLDAASDESIAASVISFEEQLRGRLAVVHRATSFDRLATAYLRLREMQAFFCTIRLLDFDVSAATIYERLRKEHHRLGKMDLRIAATTLAHSGILVTRNRRDFGQIASLPIEDWAIP